IAVNDKLETNVPGVYAIGDAVGTTYLAHGAFAEAEAAAVNATGGDEKIADYSLIPRAVYTFPEIASVGKTEETCSSEGLDVSIGRSFFRANGRSTAHNETVGEIRVVRNNSTDKIIGVTMVGAIVTQSTYRQHGKDYRDKLPASDRFRGAQRSRRRRLRPEPAQPAEVEPFSPQTCPGLLFQAVKSNLTNYSCLSVFVANLNPRSSAVISALTPNFF
ncbi:MAG: hypothetical protein ACYSYV_02510, partial [Planctomycetota bacterium]